MSPALLRKGKTKGPRPGPQELREMWQAVGSCERLPSSPRAELGATRWSPRPCAAAPPSRSCGRWRASAARVPIYGPLNCVVSRERATAARRAPPGLASGRARTRTASRVAQIARASGDRERDLDAGAPRARRRVGWRRCPDGARLARIVREPVALEAREEARLLDESLPAGLRLRE